MKFYHYYMVECVLNQEVAVIEYTVYNGTEEGIVLHSAQPTSFISEVLLFSLKKREKEEKKSCGIPHSPLWWSEAKTEEMQTSDRLFHINLQISFLFFFTLLDFSLTQHFKNGHKICTQKRNWEAKILGYATPLDFKWKCLYWQWDFFVYLESQVILPLYSGFTEWMCAVIFENVTLIAYFKYWVGRGLDYTFIQDSTF